MAQLPPKVPSMTPNWQQQAFPHQRMQQHLATTTNTTQQHNQPTSWVDEFLDFSSTKRGSHRRSISDSVTFLETGPLGDDFRNVSAMMMHGINNHGTYHGFDRLDDEQLMSMFSDDVSVSIPLTTLSTSNPSTPSDQNSNNDEKPIAQNQQHLHQQPKHEPGEVDSSFEFHSQAPAPCAVTNGSNQTTTLTTINCDTFIDPKRVKRILANRQSAQRSRVRKLQYISELERSVNSLQTEVSTLSPRVAFLDHQRLILNVDNSALKQRIAALAQDKIFKDAHQEALKKEIERLRQVYHQQSLEKMNTNTATAPTSEQQQQHQQPLVADGANVECAEKEQILNREFEV